MAEAVDQDLSALAWVHGELRRSLEAAHKSLRRYLKEAESTGQSDVDAVDPAVLRSARSQIHQGVGALELVGLPAVAAVLRASEAAVQRLIAKPALVDAAAVDAIEHASFAVLDCLARQLAGKPVSPVMLFPQYRAVQQLAGADRVHPADLWPMDFQWHELPPAGPAAPRASDDAARGRLEGLVLALMRGADARTLDETSDFCAELAAGAAEAGGDTAARRAATLWQLAAAFFEAQSRGLLAADVYSKRVASRLLAQLRIHVRGGQEPSDRLAQDLLFFCAHARAPETDRAAPRLASVRHAWRLDRLPTADYELARLGRFDPAVVALAKKRVAAAKDAWSAVAGGEMHRAAGLAEQFSLVGDSLTKLFPNGDRLAQALQAAAQTAGAGQPPSAPLAMEVATGVLYLDASIDDGELDHPELADRIARLARRIDEVRGGAAAAPLEPWMEELYRRVSDRQTMGSVVQELRAQLSEVEKQIDQYFRNPADRHVLIPVPGQLQAMRGVLSVLGLEQASAAVLHMRDDVESLVQTEVDPQRAIATGTFDRVADNLGALSLLIDMLAVQPALAKSLFRYDAATGQLRAVVGQAERPSAFGALDAAPDAPVGRTGVAAAPATPSPGASTGSPAATSAAASAASPTAPAASRAPAPAVSPRDTMPAPTAVAAADAALPLPEQARRLAAEALDAAVADAELERRLDRLAQQAVTAEQPALSRTASAALAVLRAAASADQRRGVRRDLAQALAAFGPAPAPAPAVPAPPPRTTAPAAPGGTGLEDDAEMREIFIEEAHEVVGEARAALERLAALPDSAGDLTAVRRAFHTLKGSSRMVGLKDFGEAAWGCEQLYNARLASDPRLDPPLLHFTHDALDYFAGWAAAIAAGRDAGHRSGPVCRAADALRLEGTRLPIAAPQAAPPLAEVPEAPEATAAGPAPETIALPETTEVLEPAAFADAAGAVEASGLAGAPEAPETAEAQTAEAPEAPEAPMWSAVPATPEWPEAPEALAVPEVAETIDAADAFDAFGTADAADAPGPLEATVVLDARPSTALSQGEPEPPEAAAPPTAPPAFEFELDLGPDEPSGAPASTLAERVPGLPSAGDLDLGLPPLQPALPAGEAVAGPAADEPSFELDLGALDAPAAGAPAAPVVPTGASAMGDDDQVKVIGPLRISIPLFNIFLNEADELSRRLATGLAEWAVDPLNHPLPEDSVALAHSLAGSSATVGYADLSALARALEHGLERAQAVGRGRAGEAELFGDAAEQVRHLLHQFAAGFLRPVPPELMQRLADHETWPTDIEPLEAPDRAEPPGLAGAAERAEAAAERAATPAAAEATALPDILPEPGDAPVPAFERTEVFDPARLAGQPFESAEPSPAPELPHAPVVDSVAVVAVSAFTPLADFDAPEVAPHARADAFDDDEDLDAVDAVDAELWPIFDEEAHELLPQLQSRLREWHERPGDRHAADGCMRTLHTFKGGARLAGAMRLGEMAHRLETAIEHLTAHDTIEAARIEPLLARADAMAAAFERLRADPTAAAAPEPAPMVQVEPIESIQPIVPIVPTAAPEPQAGPEPVPVVPTGSVPPVEAQAEAPTALVEQPRSDELPFRTAPLDGSLRPVAAPGGASAPAAGERGPGIDWSRFAAADASAAAAPVRPEAERAGVATAAVRVRAGLLDRLVNQAGEVAITRERIAADVKSLQGALGDLTESLERLRRQLRDIELQAETQISSRMEAARGAGQQFDPLEMDRFTRFQELTRFMAESVNDVATLQRGLQRTLQSTEDELAAQARTTRELQDDLLRTRMVEFESLSERLYRTVRQAAKETGKPVRLDIAGGAIEIDRGVLERMVGPFEHLLRNSVAHGIESAERRAGAGKDPTGRIQIQVSQSGNEVAVEFADDGGGFDYERIRRRGVERGLIDAAGQYGEAELAQLLFTPGFSTAESVTELAGRGVGLDVVRAEVNAMGGRIETSSAPGQGTRFRLLLPLTTAVTQVVMLRCGELQVAVPSTLVEIVRRLSRAETERAYASGVLEHGGEVVPFFWLGALLQAGAGSAEAGTRTPTVVVIRSAAQRVAVHVDEVVGNQEVVVKNVGPQLARLPGLAGVTLLPSGAVALIYNPVALAALYAEGARQAMRGAVAGAVPAPALPNPSDGAAARASAAPLVLVVDDSLTVRRVTQRLLAREGYRVTTAKDGLEALERLAEERPVVLLSDIEMPRMDGFDLVRNVRADPALASLPVIMITSRIAQKHRDYAAQLGVDHYLGKPYAEDELLALVARHAGADVST